MTTYAEMKTRVLAILGSLEPDIDANILFFGITSGVKAIMPWVSKQAITTFAGDGEMKIFAMPGVSYRIDAVREADSDAFLERMATGNVSKRVSPSYEWIEWPAGSLYLNTALKVNKTLDVFYSAYFVLPHDPTENTAVMDIPLVAEQGVAYWAAAHCLIPESITSSRTRQFNLKVDSGAPTDNAVENSARFLRQLFLDEMNRIPKKAGGL